MAHVIDLATQALLKSLSKAPHFNPHDPDAHLSKGDAESRRDVIGQVGATSVKARATLVTANTTSSTTDAVCCVTSFIQILSIRETDTTKKAGLAKLPIQASDWAEVKSSIYVLSVRLSLMFFGQIIDVETKLADWAQQAFSSDHNPSLYYAIPALERLHFPWNACLDNQKVKPYRNATEIGLDTVKEYYDRAADPDTPFNGPVICYPYISNLL
ncbi:hypothetical protein SISNIDRAFT_456638 [Sistotremastrum niveocremeum HHB9708]|uniref:Uncharacterized protein n=1 Tax=Sistotremastrum niveocremeum HHB9708 TaxID=1314777 RepID=A0A164SDJ2_9AGAM|nr:hypothetical protein SISNIDRAFT_456638 [Sistotremastrum niveocremeum HHB9708]